MSETPSLVDRGRLHVTAVWVVVLLALTMFLAVLLVGVVPGMKRTAEEFGVRPPGAGPLVMELGGVYAQSWSVALPLQMALIVGGVIAGRHLIGRRWVGNAFASVCLLLLAGAVVVVIAGLAQTYSAVQEGLLK